MSHPASLSLHELRGLLPPRRAESHKGEYGHVLVIGGNHGMAGAARLAAEAAARLGAGLVSIATRKAHAPWLGLTRPELMVHGVEDETALEPLLARASVLVVGPGLGQDSWARMLWRQALLTPLPKVVDADGLNLLAGESLPISGEVIFTPHPGEAGRLLDLDAKRIQDQRVAAALALQKKLGGVVVLKGAGTLIADSMKLRRCIHGHPVMASGGMGDVLAGILAALLAQGLPAWQAACLGVCLHAKAGELEAAAGRGVLALDLLPHARRLLQEISPC